MEVQNRLPPILSYPVETQAVVSTIAPLVFGPEEGWNRVTGLFDATKFVGTPIGAAFCAYPATAVLQDLFVGPAQPAHRTGKFHELLEMFGIDTTVLHPDVLNDPANGQDWTVNEIVLSSGGIDNDRVKFLRRVVNTEVDVVMVGDKGILFIEAKLTSPVGPDQLIAQALVAALVKRFTEKEVRIGLLSRKRQPLPKLDRSKWWKLAQEIMDRLDPRDSRDEQAPWEVNQATWKQLYDVGERRAGADWAQEVELAPIAKRWREELKHSVRVFGRKKRLYEPVVPDEVTEQH